MKKQNTTKQASVGAKGSVGFWRMFLGFCAIVLGAVAVFFISAMYSSNNTTEQTQATPTVLEE